MSYRFQVRGGDGSHDYKTINEIVGCQTMFREDYIKSLRNYGLVLKDGKILIPFRNAELMKIFEKTRWVCWSMVLRRLPEVIVTTYRAGERHIKALAVKI